MGKGRQPCKDRNVILAQLVDMDFQAAERAKLTNPHR
jgi:hypothetical protein